MSRARTLLVALAVTLALGVAPALVGPAHAGPLDEAKDAGLVGERVDGYVGLVDPGAPTAVKTMVETINAKRKAHYERIAERNDATVKAVAAIAGAKLIERAPPGHYVMDSSGSWIKK